MIKQRYPTANPGACILEDTRRALLPTRVLRGVSPAIENLERGYALSINSQDNWCIPINLEHSLGPHSQRDVRELQVKFARLADAVAERGKPGLGR